MHAKLIIALVIQNFSNQTIFDEKIIPTLTWIMYHKKNWLLVAIQVQVYPPPTPIIKYDIERKKPELY